jgi:hypothetical protein
MERTCVTTLHLLLTTPIYSEGAESEAAATAAEGVDLTVD